MFQPEQPKQRKEQLVKLLVVGKELVNQYLVYANNSLLSVLILQQVQTKKHPLPVFTRYAMDVKHELNWRHPTADGRQITKETAKQWHALTEAQKDVYKLTFSREMQAFNRKKAYIRDWPRLQNKIVEQF